MNKIKGPITFAKGKVLPKKMKDWVKKNGLIFGAGSDGFSYSNDKIDDWFVWKKPGKQAKKDKYYYDRKTHSDKKKKKESITQ